MGVPAGRLNAALLGDIKKKGNQTQDHLGLIKRKLQKEKLENNVKLMERAIILSKHKLAKYKKQRKVRRGCESPVRARAGSALQ